MFDNLGWPEIIMLLLLGLFVFGPERLPKVIGDAARVLRTVRHMARNATADLRDELGTDIDIDDLNPRTFVRKHLLSEDDEEMLRRPLRDAMRDFEELTHADDVAAERSKEEVGAPAAVEHPMDAAVPKKVIGPAPRRRFDADAT